MDAPTDDLAPCRCARAACRDCDWTGLALDWPTHHGDYPWHGFRALTPFCGLAVCPSIATRPRHTVVIRESRALVIPVSEEMLAATLPPPWRLLGYVDRDDLTFDRDQDDQR